MANLITLARTLLAFVVVGMLHVRTTHVYLAAAGLTLAIIWMDALDGYVARRRRECTKFGAVADILGDRVVEMTYWIIFAVLGWVPAWIAIAVAARGIVVDGFRALALERGMTAFGGSSMMKTRLGALLVSSRASRAAYGVGKALAFSLIILHFTPGIAAPLGELLRVAAYTSVYATVAFCVLRGAPVVLEARRLV
ncbi:MAG TPA: CDP-alcohol phosphatidyltransferase family protein [Gemmatimonadaceae bacterium]|nr:CDP-alcohol phosphatidyltransferase family protein [Gemmatimonadaceae bacterium]